MFSFSELSEEELALREQVRAFLRSELEPDTYRPGLGIGGPPSPEFSKRLVERGWLGMVIPKAYGGPGGTAVERFVVAEELLAAGAPVMAHWVTDRQTAPTLLAFGTEEQKQKFLPAIVQGDCFFALGMSEPGSGSDLASVSTRATKTQGGWLLNGTKIWTSGAHYAHYAVMLCRTEPLGEKKHVGLSQLIVDLHSRGVSVSPIRLLDGSQHFNEVALVDVFVPDEMVLGEVGQGWHQVTSELAFERSGPDRLLSTYPVLELLLARPARMTSGPEAERRVGELVARYVVLRRLALSVARGLDEGRVPRVEAALVKDLGTVFEQEVVDVARSLADFEQDPHGDVLAQVLAEATLTSPTCTIRGGTTEILRTVAAKHLLSEARANR
jgi:alkylation response protein AidB-like acyl-CoA dehydrogenase